MSVIKSEAVYHEERARYSALVQEIARQRTLLEEKGYAPDEVARVLQPIESRCAELLDEITVYETIKRGDLSVLSNLTIGQALIVMRIAKPLTQIQLAGMLGVDPSQVSRDEANEYRTANLERLTKVANALGLRMHMTPEGATRRSTRPTGALGSRGGFEVIPPAAPTEVSVEFLAPSEDDRRALRQMVGAH